MTILEQSLGQLARDIPGVTAIFRKYQLDFCCNGQKSLVTAAAERHVDTDQIISELAALRSIQNDPASPANQSNHDLIQHILTRYHEVHRQQLSELIALAERVEQVHRKSPECPTGLTEHLQDMLDSLDLHMKKEEQVLFPMIEAGYLEQAELPVAAMRYEHEEHGDALETLDHLTNHITLPDGACNTWTALYLGLQTFKEDLMEHIHLENNVLFDRIDGQTGDMIDE